MIEKFNEYTNESLRDQMTPKSDEDIKLGVQNYIKKLKTEEPGPRMYSILDNIRTLKGINTNLDLLKLLERHDLMYIDDLMEFVTEMLSDQYYDDKEEILPKIINLLEDDN